MILGNDVSQYQGVIDFKKMMSSGSRFVYIRAGIGYTKDKNYEINKAAAKDAGIPWGSYWVPWKTETTQKLLDAYFGMIGNDWGDLPPTIDVETDGLGLGLFITWVNQVTPRWIDTLPVDVAHIRTLLTFYTRASHFDQYSNTKGIKQELGQRTNLWVAHYTYDPNKKPYMPNESWSNYLIHQYSADGNTLGKTYGVSSKAIDMNYFNGDETLFTQWTGITDSPDIPTDPTIDQRILDLQVDIFSIKQWARGIGYNG